MERKALILCALAGALTLMLVPGAVAHHEGPGDGVEGAKAKLFGTAQDDVDLENAFNSVVSVDTTTGAPGGLSRRTANIQVETIDNQLELKYFFVDRTCNAGSPREVVLIDVDGEGRDRDLVLDGHVSPPTFTGCPMDEWRYEDLTDDQPRWDVRALTPGSQPAGTAPNVYIPWDVAEAAVMATFPNHEVIALRLVDDSGAFSPAARGCAYYDVVSLGNQTVTDWEDTAEHRPAAGGNTC